MDHAVSSIGRQFCGLLEFGDAELISREPLSVQGEKLKEVVRPTRSGKVPDVHRARCMQDVRFFIGESITEMRLVS